MIVMGVVGGGLLAMRAAVITFLKKIHRDAQSCKWMDVHYQHTYMVVVHHHHHRHVLVFLSYTLLMLSHVQLHLFFSL
jgi:hypothetical protein